MKIRGLSARALGRQVGLKHSSINYTLRLQVINITLLQRIGTVLQHNFLGVYVPERLETQKRVQELEKEVAELKKLLAEQEVAMRAKEAEAVLRENELLKKVLKLQ